MLPPMNTGWSMLRSAAGNFGLTGAEGTCCPLSVDEQRPHSICNSKYFLLAGVVRDVEQPIEPCLRKEVPEETACLARQYRHRVGTALRAHCSLRLIDPADVRHLSSGRRR